MKYRTKQTIIGLVLVGIALVVLVVFIKGISEKATQLKPKKFDIAAERLYWSQQIKQFGGEKAYQEFKQKYLSNYPQDIHYLTHLFGEILYKAEGKTAISICDSNFAFGCYHGVIVTALKERGIGEVNQLNQICIQKNGATETGCRHGIGHGLLEYLGHHNLQKALEICSSLQKVSPLGCTQGVFMEYNNPMMDSDTQFLSLRPLKSKDQLFEPCQSLPEKFAVSCYYEQSQWWIGVLKNNYSEVGNLCQSLKGENQTSCFIGVGVSAAQRVNYSVDKTTEACQKMPEKKGQINCLTGAGWVFKVNPHYQSQQSQLCENLTESEHEYCMQNSISPDQRVSS